MHNKHMHIHTYAQPIAKGFSQIKSLLQKLHVNEINLLRQI